MNTYNLLACNHKVKFIVTNFNYSALKEVSIIEGMWQFVWHHLSQLTHFKHSSDSPTVLWQQIVFIFSSKKKKIYRFKYRYEWIKLFLLFH